MSEQSKTPEMPNLSVSRMETVYSNMCRGWMTPEEVMLDFALNPNSGGTVVDEPVEVRSRVVMSISSAARLHQLLHALLTKRQEAIQQAVERQKSEPSNTAGQ